MTESSISTGVFFPLMLYTPRRSAYRRYLSGLCFLDHWPAHDTGR